LNWRYDRDYVDELYFVGKPNEDGFTLLPNSHKDFQHGVLNSDYSEKIDIKRIYTDFLIMGYTQYGEQYPAYEPEDRNSSPYSQDTIDAIDASFKNDEPLPEDISYVGYPKWYVETQNQMLLLTKEAIRRRAKIVFQSRRKSYQTIDFSCYVTKPLNHEGRFYLQTFIGQDTPVNTDMYFYKSSDYKYSKENNVITASIAGETFPVVTEDGAPIGGLI
jgi:hypothetical protein